MEKYNFQGLNEAWDMFRRWYIPALMASKLNSIFNRDQVVVFLISVAIVVFIWFKGTPKRLVKKNA